MSDNEYKGWTLFDKVIIVAKREHKYDWNQRKTVEGELQGYIVDPSNKKMLESAISWGTVTRRLDEQDEHGRYIYEKTEPAQYEFDNEGFSLELLDCAEGSSQGGKLSFWNCLVTKGEYRFKVGIAANLLLELLKSSTFRDGVCFHKVFFARCKGGVGMLHKDMEAYKEAIADMNKKAAVRSAKKTSKWEVGCNYVTLKEDDTYLCSVYRWIVPIFAPSRCYDRFIGYKKLKTPELIHFTVGTKESYSKISDYFNDSKVWLHERDKFPSRMRGTVSIECDATSADVDNYFHSRALDALTSQYEHIRQCKSKGWSYNIYERRDIGLSSSGESYVIPEDIKKLIIDCGLEYKEE